MDVMLDLETLGTRPGSALRSVGLVTFRLGYTDYPSKTIYANISRDSCRERGLREEAATVEWWSRQEKATQAALEKDQLPLLEAVVLVEKFWRDNACIRVWAQGANFDPGLWETACRVVGREAPWKFFNVRDTRTVYDIAGLDVRTVPRPGGVAHNALDDAVHQVACLQEAYRRIRKINEPAKSLGPQEKVADEQI